jgi:hypothetical protein
MMQRRVGLGILGVSFEITAEIFMRDQSLMSQDAVLGGDNPAPLHSLVLGGLGGLQQRFETGDEAAKLEALQGAIAYGDEAIGLLSHALTAESLQVRGAAYGLLKQIGSEAAIGAAGSGIPLKVGDRIYGVYRSNLSYGDDWCSIHSEINEEWQHEEYPLYRSETDISGNNFFYITDDQKENQYGYEDAEYFPELAAFSLSQSEAKELAEEEYKQAFFSMNVEFGMIERDLDFDDDEDLDKAEEDIETATGKRVDEAVARFDIAAWCERNGVEFVRQDDEEVWDVHDRLLKQLHDQQREDLLYDIWPQLGYDALAFVHEYEIDRPCYLRLAKA